MIEPRVIKHRDAYLYVGDKPEGAPDFETIECVAKSAYDALKLKCDDFERALEWYSKQYGAVKARDVLEKYRESE